MVNCCTVCYWQSCNKLVEAGVVGKCVQVLKTNSVYDMIKPSGAFCLLGEPIMYVYM